jgi:hypothetical protein
MESMCVLYHMFVRCTVKIKFHVKVFIFTTKCGHTYIIMYLVPRGSTPQIIPKIKETPQEKREIYKL